MIRRVQASLPYLLSAVLLFAAWHKANDLTSWYYNLLHYRILSDFSARLLAPFFPALEAIVALGLLVPSLRPGARLLALLLGLTFLVALSSARLRNLDIACGCFGASSKIDTWTFLRATCFTLACLGVRTSK